MASQYSRSRSVSDFSSFKLNNLEDLFDDKQMKSSKTTFRLDNSDDCFKAPESEAKEDWKYYPNCDQAVWMRSCEHEVLEPLSGKVTGKIPTWLKGTLLRNGPGCLKVGEYSFDHIFDSSALLHRFAIDNGEVTYQRRFVQTDCYKKNHASQRIVVTEFGTAATPDPCKSIFRRIASLFSHDLSDNTLISVYPFGDEFYTFTETPLIHRIDPETLETMKKVNVSDYVGIVHHTSHPHVERDGSVYNIGMTLTARGPKYSVVRFSPSRTVIDESGEEKKLSMFDQATIVASVPCRWMFNPSYMHSFGITENYFIIIEQPLAIALTGMISHRVLQNQMRPCLKWHENENTHIHVVSRETGVVERTFVAETFFYLHTINQFETRDGDYIVLDMACYRDSQVLDCLYVDAIKNMHNNPNYGEMFRTRPLRFVMPMKRPESNVPLEENLITVKTVNQGLEAFENEASLSGDSMNTGKEKIDHKNVLHRPASAHRLPDGSVFLKPELLCDMGSETPRINYDFNLGREYRYFYGISSDVDLDNCGTLIKVDILTKTKRIWNDKNVYPSEPVFVPNPNGKAEDDGLILSAAVWRDNDTMVALLVLDAMTFKEIGRVTFDTPGPVPKCLHGWFTSSK